MTASQILMKDARGLAVIIATDETNSVHTVTVQSEIVNVAGAAAYVQPGTDAEWQVLGDSYATPTHSVVTVTTASGVALAANANRVYALLVNDSDTVMYISLGAAAVANQGIRLNANGGSYEISRLHGNLYAGAINAIHGGSGNKTLLVTEGV